MSTRIDRMVQADDGFPERPNGGNAALNGTARQATIGFKLLLR